MSRPRCYVGNIPYNTTEDDLRKFFHPVRLSEVRIITDRETGRPRGFAFVEPEAGDDTNKLLEFDGRELGNRTVVVNMAKEKPRGGGGDRSGDRRDRGHGRREGRNGRASTQHYGWDK